MVEPREDPMTPSPWGRTDPKIDTSRADGSTWRSAAGSKRRRVRLSSVDGSGGLGSDQPTEPGWKPSSRAPGDDPARGDLDVESPNPHGWPSRPCQALRRRRASTARGCHGGRASSPPAPRRRFAARRGTSCARQSRARRPRWCRRRGLCGRRQGRHGHAVVGDGGEPPELLAPEVVDLGIAEQARRVLLASPSKLVKYCAHPHGAVAARWNAPPQLPSRPS
jgi:hypothetical protein